MGFMDKLKGAAESAQAATSKVGVGASGDQMALANKAKKLRSDGVDPPGHIDTMTATGNTDTPGGTEYTIGLTITPAAGDAYQVIMTQYVYPASPFSEDENVVVKVDPADPMVAMIWGKA